MGRVFPNRARTRWASRASTVARWARSPIASRAAALWTGARGYLLGAALYLPTAWVTRRRPPSGPVPASIRFQEKWRQALTLLRQVRASGFTVTGVLADAEFGDNRVFRGMLHRLRLPYTLGILVASHGLSRHPAPASGTPGDARTAAQTSAVGHRRHGTPARRGPRGGRSPLAPRTLAESAPRAALDGRLRGDPRHAGRRLPHRRLMPEIWLLAERDVGATPRTKYYFVHLPPTASLIQIVRLAHHRWAIEQQLSRPQDRTRPRSFRGPHIRRLASPHRTHGDRLQLSPSRAPADPRPPDVSQGARHCAGRSLPRTCLPSDRITSPASRRCGPFNYGSDKVVLVWIYDAVESAKSFFPAECAKGRRAIIDLCSADSAAFSAVRSSRQFFDLSASSLAIPRAPA